MKTAIINSKEVFENNPTLCISPERYTGGCIQCFIMKDALARNNNDIQEAMKQTKIKCKPIITEEQIKLYNLKGALLETIKNIKSQIDEIDEKIREIS